MEKLSQSNLISKTSIENSYMTKVDDVTCYLSYNVTNGYYSAIQYQGSDFNQFSKISSLQIAKIAYESANDH